MKHDAILKLLFPKHIDCFIPTGSEVYGFPTESSDIDFLINLTYRQDVIDRLRELSISWTACGNTDGIKFPVMSKDVNLIFLDQKNLYAWEKTTQAMIALRKYANASLHSLLRDKTSRIGIFAVMVEQFGGDPTCTKYSSMPKYGMPSNLGTMYPLSTPITAMIGTPWNVNDLYGTSGNDPIQDMTDKINKSLENFKQEAK